MRVLTRPPIRLYVIIDLHKRKIRLHFWKATRALLLLILNKYPHNYLKKLLLWGPFHFLDLITKTKIPSKALVQNHLFFCYFQMAIFIHFSITERLFILLSNWHSHTCGSGPVFLPLLQYLKLYPYTFQLFIILRCSLARQEQHWHRIKELSSTTDLPVWSWSSHLTYFVSVYSYTKQELPNYLNGT